MPPNLLDLPNEILDGCLEELQPPLSSRESVSLCDALDDMPTPVYLCRLMAVSKAFHELALPWVWKRAKIHIRNPLRPPKLPPDQWSYLCDHPKVAAHIHLLNIFVDVPAYPPAAIPVHDAVCIMTNLRVLRISSWPEYGFPTQLLTELLNKPTLHTFLALQDPAASVSSIPYLRRLHLGRWDGNEAWDGHKRLVEAAICLESLTIEGLLENHEEFPIPWETLAIPWATLCELSIIDSEDWYLVLENFSSWKKRFPSTTSPLAEFFISLQQSGINSQQISHLAVFGSQLHTLCLEHDDVIHLTFLDTIVYTCPLLCDLRIFAKWGVDTWNEPSAPAKSLGRLSALKHLQWDHTMEFPGPLRTFKPKFRTIVPIVAQWCYVLESMSFSLRDSTITTLYRIRRDDMGAFQEYVEEDSNETYKYNCSPRIWDSRNFDRI